MKVICVLLILLLLPLSVNSTDDLLFTINYDHLTINKTCLIANSEQTVELPIYNGFNLISIPLYPDNPSLESVFGGININGDMVRIFNNAAVKHHAAEYFTGYGWYEYEPVEPIKPCAGYEYSRVGADCLLIVTGTYLSKDDTCNIYNYLNFKNKVGTNIIRPKRCIYDE